MNIFPTTLLSAGPLEFDGSVASAATLDHDESYLLASGAVVLAFEADIVAGRRFLVSKDSAGFDDGGHFGLYIEDGRIGLRLQDTSATYDVETAPLVAAGRAHHLAMVFGAADGARIYLDGVEVARLAYAGGLLGNAEPIVLGANQWSSGNRVADRLRDPFDGRLEQLALYAGPLDPDQVARLHADWSGATDPANTAPEAGADLAFVLAEDTGLNVDAPGLLAGASDPDGDPLVAALASAPAHGTVTILPGGGFTYTPDADFAGTDAFAFAVEDGRGGSDTATVTLTVTPEPDAPRAADDVAATGAGTPATIAVLANDSDPDGDPLAISGATDGASGTVAVNGDGTLTYTPAPGFEGADSFAYTVADGTGRTATATVTVTVSGAAPAPVPLFSAPEAVVLDGTDADVIELPHDPVYELAEGTIALRFAPADTDGAQGLFVKDASGYAGGGAHFAAYLQGTRLEVRFQDGTRSETLTIPGIEAGRSHHLAATFGPDGGAVYLDGVRVAATALVMDWSTGNVEAIQWGGRGWGSDSGATGFDAPFAGTLSDRAIYGVALDAAQVALLAAGGGGGADPNAPPVAADDAVTTAEDTALTFDPAANDTDPDGDPLAASAIASAPAHGSATVEPDGTVTYTPSADFAGADRFEVQVSDGRGGLDTAAVSVTVTPVPDDPVAAADTAATGAGEPVVIPVLANDTDPDGDALSVVAITDGGFGTVAGNGDGTVTYTPAAGATGTDSFTYTVGDGTGRTATATVTVSVAAETPPLFSTGPFAFDGTTGTAQVLPHDDAWLLPSGTVEVTFTAGAVDGRRFLLSKDSAGFDDGGHLGLYLEDGRIVARFQDTAATHVMETGALVAPGRTHHLAVVFGESGGMTLYLDGQPVADDPHAGGLLGNREPLVIGANQWSSGDLVADRLLDAFDGTISDVSLHGTAFGAGGIAALYAASDAAAAGDNRAPVAAPDAYTAAHDAALTVEAAAGVLANDIDPDGDALTASVTAEPGKGTLTLAPDGGFTYTPFAGATGLDSFGYAVADGNGGTGTGTATITIAGETADIFSDDFGGDALRDGWTFEGIAGGAAPGDSGGVSFLALTSPAGVAVDAYTAMTTPRLLQDIPAGDFQIAVRLLNEPSQPYQEHGLLVIGDDATWLRFDVAYTSSGLRLIVGDVDAGGRSLPLFRGIEPGEVTHLRITRTGDTFAFETSGDGAAWETAYTLTSDIVPTRVGPFAGSTSLDGTPPPGFTSQIDWFQSASDPLPPPGNAPPVAADDLLFAAVDLPLAIDVAADLLSNDTDPDGDALAFAGIAALPAHGTLTDDGAGGLTYTPEAGFTGTDTFAYAVSDGEATDTATVTVAVGGAGGPAPLLDAGPYAFAGTAEAARVIAHDPRYALAAGALEIVFTADAVSGARYLVSKDSSGFDAGGHLGVSVEDGRIHTRFQTDSASFETATGPVIAAGQRHHLMVTFDPAGGTRVYVDGVLQATGAYTGGTVGNAEPLVVGANQWKSGNGIANALEDPFSGIVETARLFGAAFDAATVAARAADAASQAPEPGAPRPQGDLVDAAPDRTTILDPAAQLLANDTDPDGDPLEIVGLAAPQRGTVEALADGTLAYTPEAGFLGTDHFRYTVSDGSGLATATVVIAVAEPVTTVTGGSADWQRVSSATGAIPLSETPENTAALVLDADRDGLLDFVIAGRNGPPALTLYRQTADGWDVSTIETGEHDIEAGGTVHDVDGDGDDDLVFGGDSESDEVWWWENPFPDFDPAASWTKHTVKSGIGRQQHDMIFGDFDGDGTDEFVYWNQRAPNETRGLYLAEIPDDPRNAGLWPATLIYNGRSEGMAKGDIDGDGIEDLVAGGLWFKYDGAGGYTAITLDGTFATPQTAVGDIDGDGQLEIFLSGGDLPGPLVYYDRTGDATDPANWTATTLFEDTYNVHSLEVADMDGDGNLDVFAAEMNLNGDNPDARTWVLFGDGAGGFDAVEIASGIDNHESTVADLDGDGDLDILGKGFTDRELNIWYNTLTEPTLGAWTRTAIDEARPWRAVFEDHGDIDGDGLPDIVTGAWWYRNPGAVSGDWARATIGDPLNNMAAVFDADGDGDLDILGTQGIGSSPNAAFAWAENDGAGGFTVRTNVESGQGSFLQGTAVARLGPDGTGPLTVLLSWQNGAGGLQALEVPEDPATGTWTWSQISPFSAGEGLDTADIDGDGDTDILTGFVWLENDAGAWTERTLHVPPPGGEPDRVHLVDMDGDGDLDSLVGYGHESSITTLAWYEQPDGNPTGLWTEHVIANDLKGNPQSVDVADLDADGDLDVVAGEHLPSDPGDLDLLVFENLDGAGGAWQRYLVHSGDEHHDGARLADLDRDGDLDIYSIGWSTDVVTIYENLTNGFDPV